MVRQLGEDADRLVPLSFHRVLRVVDEPQRGLERVLGLPLPGLVLRRGVGELLLLDAQAFLFAAQQLQARMKADSDRSRFRAQVHEPVAGRQLDRG